MVNEPSGPCHSSKCCKISRIVCVRFTRLGYGLMPCSRKACKRCKRISRSSAMDFFFLLQQILRIYCNIDFIERIVAETSSSLAKTKTGLRLRILWAAGRSIAATSWEDYEMERMMYSFTPPGVETMTRSPTLWPSSAFPTGDSLEMRPALGFASYAPTSL